MAKKKGLLKLAIVGAVVAVLGVGVYHGIKHQDKIKDAWNNLWGIEEQVPEEKPTPDDPSGGEEQPLVNTVTIEVEGQDPTTQSVATGGLMEEPEAPTKEGYIFQGWALKGTTEPIDFSTFIVEENITLVPLWLEEPVKVTSASLFTFNGSTLTGYVGEETDIVIPSSYSLDDEGNPIDGEDIVVDTIGNSAFKENLTIKSVVIPDTVTTIGTSVFVNCSSLTSITIPASVTSIGNNIYQYGLTQGCSALTSVKVEEGNPMYDSREDCNAVIETATNKLVAGCTTTTFPKSVTSIGWYAFSYLANLTSITIPGTIAEVGEYAFYGSALQDVVLEEGVMSIKRACFESCPISSISIPTTIQSIGDDNYRVIDDNASAFNTYDNANYLGNEDNPYLVLMSATSKDITSCEVNENCKMICWGAFSNCTSLTQVTIPNTVTNIRTNAFYGCTALTYNTYDNANYLGNEDNPYLVLMSATSKEITSCTINENCKVIYDIAFSNCTALTEISIPEGIEGLGSRAFMKCTSLTQVSMPSTLKEIGENAFRGCTGLTEISIPDSVTSIGGYAFYGCTGFTSITIPASVTSIGDNAFGIDAEVAVIFEGSTPATITNYQNFSATVTIYVPDEDVELYKSIWTKFADQIKAYSEYEEA